MDEIGTEAKLDGNSGAKVKMCTPIHGLSVCLNAEKPESPCTGVHIFTFAPQSRPIWLLYQSRPILFFLLNKVVERTVASAQGVQLRIFALTLSSIPANTFLAVRGSMIE